jgi:hypothetical protein
MDTKTLVTSAEIDPGVTPSNSWPIFTWIGQQVGNSQTLGVVAMVALLIAGIFTWIAGSGRDNSRQQTAGKWMVFLSILGAVLIGAAPAIIKWASGQNPISSRGAEVWAGSAIGSVTAFSTCFVPEFSTAQRSWETSSTASSRSTRERPTDDRPTDADLKAATSIGNLVLYLAVPLTIAAMIWQIMRSASQGRAQGVRRALVGGIAMVAGTRIVFWNGPELVRGFDETTIALWARSSRGQGGLGTTLKGSVGLSTANSVDEHDGRYFSVVPGFALLDS